MLFLYDMLRYLEIRFCIDIKNLFHSLKHLYVTERQKHCSAFKRLYLISLKQAVCVCVCFFLLQSPIASASSSHLMLEYINNYYWLFIPYTTPIKVRFIHNLLTIIICFGFFSINFVPNLNNTPNDEYVLLPSKHSISSHRGGWSQPTKEASDEGIQITLNVVCGEWAINMHSSSPYLQRWNYLYFSVLAFPD